MPDILRRIGLLVPAGKILPGTGTADPSPRSLLGYAFVLLLSVAAIITIFVVGVLESRDRMLTQSEIQLRQKTALLEAYVAKILDANGMVLQNVASEIDPVPWSEIVASEKISGFLASQKRFLKHSGVIALVDADGQFIANSETVPVKTFSVSDRDYFRHHRDDSSTGIYLGEPITGRLYGKLSLTMSIALRRPGSTFDGLILITMPLDYFSELFDGAASPSDIAQLLRDDGTVAVNVPVGAEPHPAPSWFAEARAVNLGRGTKYHVIGPDGISRMVAYRRITGYPFYVTYGIDEHALLQGWRKSVQVYGTVLALALTAFMSSAWIARRRSLSLIAMNESLAESGERLLVSQDEERRSIARDLHDSTGQHLIGASMELETIRSGMPELPDETRRALSRTAELIALSNDELRTLSYILHPPMLDESGLPNALELLVVGFERRSGLEIELRVAPSLGEVRPHAGVELALFRIVQEALTNIYRHANASKALIRLVRQGSPPNTVLSLTVKDDGIGIERRSRDKVGVGLSGMQARLRPLGGSFHISTGKKGTTISVKVPG